MTITSFQATAEARTTAQQLEVMIEQELRIAARLHGQAHGLPWLP